MINSIFNGLTKIFTILLAAIGIYQYGKTRGKKDVENDENKRATENIQSFNKIKAEIRRLSDPELEQRVSRWKRNKAK